MSEDEEAFSIDPHGYFGVVLDLPEALIPSHLAQELARCGTFDLWQYQAFGNHLHSDYSGETEERLRDELRCVAAWTKTLQCRFPDLRFVVEAKTLDRMTWYQATDAAPTEDDEDYEPYSPTMVLKLVPQAEFGPREEWNRYAEKAFRAATERASRVGSDGPCEKCGERSGFTEPRPHPSHRGARTMTCGNCGETLIHSTRTIRHKVGEG